MARLIFQKRAIKRNNVSTGLDYSRVLANPVISLTLLFYSAFVTSPRFLTISNCIMNAACRVIVHLAPLKPWADDRLGSDMRRLRHLHLLLGSLSTRHVLGLSSSELSISEEVVVNDVSHSKETDLVLFWREQTTGLNIILAFEQWLGHAVQLITNDASINNGYTSLL